jgi:selenocysteine-specific elongation factor
MPQTVEHLAILDLLEVEAGVVVLTKRDLVDDEWLELVTEETRERLAGSALAQAPIVAVSAARQAGLDDLLAVLDTTLAALPAREAGGRPRLPVDRVFSVAGFGTVVTGTLLGGPLEIGQELELLPAGLRGRVRGLQSHGRKTQHAQPGARTAVNLSGIDRAQVARGAVLTSPGWLTTTTLLDAQVRLTADAPGPLEQNQAVDVFIGAAEAAAHVTLLDRQRIEPGESGWVQLRFSAPLVATAGERFIIRQPSPSLTIGGGRVIDTHPRRHRRFRADVISALETRASGTPEERFVQALAAGPQELRSVADALGIDSGEARTLLGALGDQVVKLGSSGAVATPNTWLARADWLARLLATLAGLLEQHHRAQPLRRGAAREEVRSRLGLNGRVFDALTQTLAGAGQLVDLGGVLALPGREIALSAEQQRAADRFVAALDANPNAPPAPAEFGISAELLAALADQGTLVRGADGVVFGAARLAEIQRETLRLLERQPSLTLAQFRDHFGSSRKYAQALLEYFDQQRVTRRVGDARVRGSGGAGGGGRVGV